jgi:LmbE family N-acetylglucosaminyl deacetylase
VAAKPARLMVIAAHPQDPFERAGGTVAKHLARGDEAMFVSLTTGVVTHAFNIFPATGADKLRDLDKVKDRKRQEFEQAAATLGLTAHRVFDFNESPMVFGRDEYLALVGEIREFRPDVVLCPHPTEFGRLDHMDAGRFSVAAVDYARADGFPSPLAPHLVRDVFMFHYEDFRTDQFMGAARHSPDLEVDITAVIDRKRAAMAIFGGTQAKAGEDYTKKLDRFFASVDGASGYAAGTGYVERFSRLNPARVNYLPLAEL